MTIFDRKNWKVQRKVAVTVLIAALGIVTFFVGTLFAASNNNSANVSPPTSFQDTVPQEPRVIVSLGDLQNTFRGVSQEVLPVVVEINVISVIRQNIPRIQSPWDFFFAPPEGQEYEEREFRRPGLGSGVIVRKDKDRIYVLTNSHVVGDADEISVRLYDQREFPAKIVGKDPRMDLALIEFNTREEIPVANLGDSDSLFVGDWVLAVGNPYGFESTVTAGIISALGRRPEAETNIGRFTDYIQTDAAINPGNSGGALVNLNGEVIGINTWIASQTGGNVGLGFAIPINNAKKAINDFITEGRIAYGWLGVVIEDIRQPSQKSLAEDLRISGKPGALVRNTYKGSPAEKGGILPGDFIISVNNQQVNGSDHLSQIIGTIPPGREVGFRIIRYGSEMELKIKLAEREAEEKLQASTDIWPAISAIPITEEIRKELQLPSDLKGVALVGILNNTAPAVAGLRTGDILLEIGDTPINTVMDFYKALNSSTRRVMFTVYRQGSKIMIGLVK